MRTSRELVYDTLNGTNTGRVPRQLWTLPWAEQRYPEQMARIRADFPDDILGIGVEMKEKSPVTKGDPCEVGEYVDDFGCVFTNIHRGIIGEVRTPLVREEDWSDWKNVHIPTEWLTFEVDDVNRNIERFAKDKFTAAGFWARPFEQLQFIRGTENLYVDLMDMPPQLEAFIQKLHGFYCSLFEKWGKSDVDCMCLMDDWGAQRSLLIHPDLWRRVFRPLYKDYIDITHSYGKKAFMHSDGYILDILPDLIDLGLDAVNSQIFCMGLENLRPFAGRITFWGEIDRQNLLPSATTEEIRQAVRQVKETLYRNGGCIAQCEFGPGANPDNVYAVFEEWNAEC